MKTITIIDTTLCREDSTFSFKERIEIARLLTRLNVDVIELPAIENAKRDVLFVRTVSPFVKESVLSVQAGMTMESIELAAQSLSAAAHPRIRIELPVSTVGMEYTCHKKPDKMLAWIAQAVAPAKEKCADVEFCAVDATRAEADFLRSAVETAVAAGATAIAVCDSAAEMLPDDFANFAAAVAESVSVPVSVRCDNKNGLACAQAILSVRRGVNGVKTCVGGSTVPMETFGGILKDCGNSYGFTSRIRQTELHRTAKQIAWVTDGGKRAGVASVVADDNGMKLDANDSQADVIAAVAKLGYDLSEEDGARVYEEFQRVAAKKAVGNKELEAIVASTALQVPATYKLVSYLINNGNIISSSAQLTLEKNGEPMQGVCIGDGPIDAAFLAIESITGRHYELDDFQLQAVTEGREAMGQTIVRLRSGGKLYSGRGISTDIVCAGINAYLSALNKIVYEEEEA